MRFLGLAALLAAVVAMWASACSGGEDAKAVSGAEYLRQADAVYCDVGPDRPAEPETFDLKATAEYLDQTIPEGEQALDELRALTPPLALAEKAERFTRSMETLLSAAEQIREEARAGDLEAYTAALGRAFEIGLVLSNRAIELGLDDC